MGKLAFFPIGFLLIFLTLQYRYCCFNVMALLPRQRDYDIYHRHSDEVIGVVGGAGLPRKGTAEYYSVWTTYDQQRRRRLSAPRKDLPAITFAGGDVTASIKHLGSLHYARIYVGTPPVPFFVALDTGSVIFWLPCGCNDCPRSFMASTGQQIILNSYNYSKSQTSEVVLCGSPYCFPPKQEDCPLRAPKTYPCPYEVNYMSENTSSRGILVKDIMHIETYSDNGDTRSGAPVVFGCGEVETGTLLEGGSVNGLLGLGYGALDVTSLLSSQGLVRNSFSMCFAPNGYGRIAFGDSGDPDQMFTPLLDIESNHYNIEIEQICVENVVMNISLAAIFDSGTTFTYLTGEAYTLVTKIFNSFVNDPLMPMPIPPFEYCYIARTDNGTSFRTPSLSFKTKGGADFHVLSPTSPMDFDVFVGLGDEIYCLGIIKDEVNKVNIIGHNFMTGYRVIFDREKLILGWKSSDCKRKEANPVVSYASTSPKIEGIPLFLLISFLFLYTLSVPKSVTHFD